VKQPRLSAWTWALMVAAVVLVIALATRLDWSEVWAAMRTVDLPLLGAAFTLGAVAILVRGVRAAVMLPARSPAEVATAFAAVAVGLGVNSLVPARAGDATRVILLGRSTSAGVGGAAAAIAVERILDLVALAGVVAVAATAGVRSAAPSVPWIAGIAVVVLGLLAVAVRTPPADTLVSSLERLPYGTRLYGFASRAVDTLRTTSSGPRLAAAVGLTFVAWALDVSIARVVLAAAGMPAAWSAGTVVVLGVVAAVVLPAAPAYVGTYHAAVAAAARAISGVDWTTAIAFATVLHALHLSLKMVGASLGMLALGMDPGSLRRSVVRSEDPPPAC
jgi:uncharacterized protein (TIRG00374 family)